MHLTENNIFCQVFDTESKKLNKSLAKGKSAYSAQQKWF